MTKTSKTTEKQSPLVRAYARDLRIAPRKIRLLTGLVRGLNVSEALAQLEHSSKKGAIMVIKLLKSAIANAKNNFSLNPEKLYIKDITADIGRVMKRYFPRARGSAFVIRRKLSHLNLILEERNTGKKVSGSSFAFLKDRVKAVKPESIDHAEAVAKTDDKETVVTKRVFKTDEQVKMNKVQNKRRLFNRKSGE